MTKKRPPSQDSPPEEKKRYEYSTVGKGSTKRVELKINKDVPLTKQDIESAYIDPVQLSRQSPFDYCLWEHETISINFLKLAGFKDEELFGNLLELVEARGFRRGEKIEWHMAEILGRVRDIRASRDKGNMDEAMALMGQLGYQLKEAWVRFGVNAAAGKKGGDVTGPRQTAKRIHEWDAWQEEADRVKAKHPNWCKEDVVRGVHKRFPNAAPRTIRLHIKVEK
jgi:hypothetical protein